MKNSDYGATMRLGDYPCKIKKATLAYDAYKKTLIKERHRHRYEVNPEYIEQIEKAGLTFSGQSPDGKLMEIAELPKNKHFFMVGSQFHPEFTSSPLKPNPLFISLIKATITKKKRQ
jgi:CTP synthase